MSNSFYRITVRGVGSSAPPSEYDLFDLDNAFDDDIFDAAPVSSGPTSVSCPPPSGSSSRYAFVGTRKRDTVSMLAVPLPDDVRKTG